MNEQKELIKVTMFLKDSQYVGMNKWICTVHGEQREVTNSVVVFYSEGIFQAMNAFNEEELNWWSMEKKL